ncbi:MAG TPA: ATP-binding protein, partial [Candidatus Cloacimonadota bacterium]|nr:ATP-binding protein [Candidatus Cloacimonadota bacterium]
MEVHDVLQILSQGEDSRNQFIENVHNSDALAAEMVAFSNTLGGKLFVGVKDDGTIIGLSTADISRLNQLISNASSENIKPAINPLSIVMTINSKKLLIIDIPKGLNKLLETHLKMVLISAKLLHVKKCKDCFSRLGLSTQT